jgi:hypothetical protein
MGRHSDDGSTAACPPRMSLLPLTGRAASGGEVQARDAAPPALTLMRGLDTFTQFHPSRGKRFCDTLGNRQPSIRRRRFARGQASFFLKSARSALPTISRRSRNVPRRSATTACGSRSARSTRSILKRPTPLPPTGPCPNSTNILSTRWRPSIRLRPHQAHRPGHQRARHALLQPCDAGAPRHRA